MIQKAQKEDLREILELQYLAYQSEAKLFGDMDIPPLKQTIEEVYEEFAQGTFLKIVDELFTSTKSISNIRLYERLGYKIFKEEAVYEELQFVYLEKC